MLEDTVSSAAGMVLLAAVTSLPVPAQVFWINEFHYDNSGSDRDEFVEIAAPSTFTDLAQVRLTLYNGGDGTPYGAPHLLSSFTQGDSAAGWTLYSKSISGLQNGAPDGMSLDLNGAVIEFMGYEGSFVAASGPAQGRTSVDIGLSESESTLIGSSLGLTGSASSSELFSWAALATASPGQFNAGQSFVPEPAECGLAGAGGLLIVAGWMRRKRPPVLGGSPPVGGSPPH